MPVLEKMDLNQTAVLWLKLSENQYAQPVVNPVGVEIRVRWNDKRTQRQDKDGNPIFYDATVVVSQDVPVDSILWLGELADIPGSADPPVPESDLFKVSKINTALDLKGRPNHRRRELMLDRFNDTLPVS